MHAETVCQWLSQLSTDIKEGQVFMETWLAGESGETEAPPGGEGG